MLGTPMRSTAARALVDQLMIHGVDHVFCVPGESFLSVLDALYERSLATTIFRNEGGASMAAEAYAKATGRPGVCFVTRGPGAANAFAGVHVARHDSDPLILFIGQVKRSVKDREAFQEVDYRAMFGGHTKWTAEIDDSRRIPEYLSHAFQVACSGRPGPVVLSLPCDMLEEEVAASFTPRYLEIETAPASEDMARLAALIEQSVRPALVLGGTRWDEGSRAQVREFAEAFDLPVATSYRRAPLFDALHRCYVGDLGLNANPSLVERLRNSDLVIVLGGRLGEIPSQGYRLFDIPTPQTAFVHVFPQPEEFGRVYAPTLAIHSSPRAFARALRELTPPTSRPWRDETARAHEEYLRFSSSFAPSGDVDLARVIIWLRENIPAEAVICNGAGNYASWLHRYYRFRRFATHIAPTSATMGYGVPAAIALQRLHPERLIVSLAGDGDFLMNGQEFATAAQYRLPIVFIICDNASYGTIRMHQEANFPGRVIGTDLLNPDFASYARAFGGWGALIERTDDFPSAFAQARESGLPSILHLKIDPDRITPTATLSDIRRAALSRLQSAAVE
ncbi:thiamine pyrophosphate-binding protein [Methylocystis bryophila]|uniref:thiamine pyrophosphate-binding protein n=1 Tax=Methylocystis bryophila TaxID=655015 RepID=UPI0024917DC0|nr:thiamine pyrophosphate-binding protein [Methylocystis bryophila]BDV37515.1 thiamine pyrophosphate protein [Methylocystis bryophila]